jgi:hypothetical protein
MLTREQAQEQLNKLQSRDYAERFLAQAREAGGPVQDAVFAILGRNAGGEALARYGEDWPKIRGRVRAFLEGGSARDRRKALQLLFGELADGVETTLSYLPTLTYQQYLYRRPFRVKNRPELFRDRRIDWLQGLAQIVCPYRSSTAITPPWLAAWAPYLGYGSDNTLGVVFAAVIDGGGKDADEVYSILTASARNEHEIGSMGRHVTRALLTCSKPEAWEFAEGLLLAAQRQEGLRQVVLETVDEAHPVAFRRMLRLIIENDLVRFSAVARAVNVWFGFQWDSISTGAFNKILTQIAGLLEDESARKQALRGSDAESVYHALWAIAYDDAVAALKAATGILRDKKAEKRFAAVTLVSQLALPEGRSLLLEMLEDEDLRIAVAAHRACFFAVPGAYDEDGNLQTGKDDHFERLEKLLERVPPKKTVTMKPLIWPWTALSVDRRALLRDLVDVLGERPVGLVLKYREELDLRGRVGVALRIGNLKEWDAEARRAALEMAGDPSSQVREHVLTALRRTRIAPADVGQLESYLTRKAADLRRGVVGLLLSQEDAAALESADRLLASAQANQRLAGLELLRQLTESDRKARPCRERAKAYEPSRRQISKEEQTQLAAILAEKQDTLTLDNALGLMNPAERTPVVPPRPIPFQYVTPAAIACLQALDQLVEEHKNEPVKTRTYQGEQEQLLGNVQWGLPWPDWSKACEEQLEKFPLRGLVEQWYDNRPQTLRDEDGFDLVRAAIWLDISLQDYSLEEWKEWERRSPTFKAALHAVSGGQPFVKLRYPSVVQCFLSWLRFTHPQARLYDFLLDANEALLASLPTNEWLLTGSKAASQRDSRLEVDPDWRDASIFNKWLTEMPTPDHVQPPTTEHLRRSWQLLHWLDEPVGGVVRRRPSLSVTARAFHDGYASEADVLDHVLGRRGDGNWRWYGERDFRGLWELTARKPPPFVGSDARLLALADRCRERLLAIELARGETETPASRPATQLGALFGADKVVTLLHALGKASFHRFTYWSPGGYSKPAVLSQLVRVTFPTDADTPAEFICRMREAVNAGQFPEDRLIELAFHAPQWVPHVSAYFDWPGFQEGVWWFLAHMSAYVGNLGDIDVGEAEPKTDDRQGDGQKKELSPWEKIIRQRTPLTDAERRQGAVDMAWFRRVYEELGDRCWRRMGEAAKWGGGSHRARKAVHLGDVILGKANLRELIASVTQKYRKESVRLLGIYPLPAGAKRDQALAQRYKVMVDYRRYAKGLSAMSKPQAMQAAQIGLENLARTAGFPDPIRLEWAQEARALADIAHGPVKVTQQGVTAALVLDEQRQPQITYERAGKPLKSLPAQLKKNKKFAELIERRTELRRQSSRIKESLENAMCRGDVFTAGELRELSEHPLLAPLLERLVLAGEGVLGYPARNGKALHDFAGKLEPVKKNESLRIAHPHDLLKSGKWHEWQHECFQAERVQPFKQVFRELYVVTRQEKKDGAVSLRYDGHQVNPQQAAALFNTRNWNTTDGIWKTFFDLQITASVWFKFGWGTPMDVEGWTLQGVEFRLRDEPKPMPLDKVPPRLFSEVMRDLDLVVSVAHRGGVDPEASASTVEMRANLLRETCSLLMIRNYKIKDAHVLIDGKLGDYSVHLGSAMVHWRPGGAVCILPVHAQHRGRLFLPFADDDPKTAEVLSKVLLLARDQGIQDPTILEQLR